MVKAELRTYYERRAAQEREAATNAQHHRAREIHLSIAEAYERRQGSAGQGW